MIDHNHDDCKNHNEDSQSAIPIPRRSRIQPHESGMNIKFRSPCQRISDLFSMPKVYVNRDRGDSSKGGAVDKSECCREERWGIRLVLGLTKSVIIIQDFADIVDRGGIVVKISCTNGKICGIPHVRIVQARHNNPKEQGESGEDINC